MAIEIRDPETILLAGTPPIVADRPAKEAITPGMICKYEDDSGVLAWAKADTADAPASRAVLLEQTLLNKGVDDACAAGDLVPVAILRPGDVFWGIIPSGQNITQGAVLQSNGDGKLKAVGSGAGAYVALESKNATADTRIRVEVL